MHIFHREIPVRSENPAIQKFLDDKRKLLLRPKRYACFITKSIFSFIIVYDIVM